MSFLLIEGETHSTELQPKIDLRSQHAWVAAQFTHFYESAGYTIVPDAGILPENDPSVVFTGATITPLKQYVETGIPSPGFCMVQKCLRVKDVKKITDVSVIPEWTNYFTMCGILSAPGRLQELSAEAFDLLTKAYAITTDRLIVNASSEDRDMSAFWKDKGVTVIEDDASVQYRWKYGMKGIRGRGITFQLRNEHLGVYRELGNIVSVETETGEVRGYEFGFGLESMLSTQLGFKKPVEASLVSAVIPYQEGLYEKVSNALVTSTVLLHHGIEPSRGRENHILKQLVKGLSFLRRKTGISIEELVTASNAYEAIEFHDATQTGNRLAEAIYQYEADILRLWEYGSNQLHARLLRGEVNENLWQKIRVQGQRTGVNSQDIEHVISVIQSGSKPEITFV